MSQFPVDPFEIAQREVERLWRDLVYHRLPSSHFSEQPWAPPTDVVVNDTSARVIVELAGVPRDNVHVRLRGACCGCPSASYTLSMGVERIIKKDVPGVGRVIAD